MITCYNSKEKTQNIILWISEDRICILAKSTHLLQVYTKELPACKSMIFHRKEFCIFLRSRKSSGWDCKVLGQVIWTRLLHPEIETTCLPPMILFEMSALKKHILVDHLGKDNYKTFLNGWVNWFAGYSH